MFSHNTNLWLSKHPTLQPLEGHVGFVKLSDPPDTYMGKFRNSQTPGVATSWQRMVAWQESAGSST